MSVARRAPALRPRPAGGDRGDTRGVPDRPDRDPDPDPDEMSRRAAVRTVAWRALAWLVPLIAVGALLVGLGLPTLVVVPVLVLAWIVVVFELDL